MARRYRTTAKQIGASRRNLVKARNARRRKAIAIVAGVGAVGAGVAVASRKGVITKTTGANVSTVTGKRLPRGVSVSRTGVVLRTGKNKTRINVNGAKIAGSPSARNGYKPPNARTRRKMDKFNYAHTESQKERSAMRFHPKGVAGVGNRRIETDEVGRRTNSYMNSLKSRKQTERRRRQAQKYYETQPRYDARGSSPSHGRRGRKRKYELKNRTK